MNFRLYGMQDSVRCACYTNFTIECKMIREKYNRPSISMILMYDLIYFNVQIRLQQAQLHRRMASVDTADVTVDTDGVSRKRVSKFVFLV